MWIVKGILLGTGLFSVGTIMVLLNAMRPFESSKATGISVLTGLTTENPLWWAAFGASLVIGCWLVGTWPVKV